MSQESQLDPDLTLALRELKHNHSFKTLWGHLKERREDMISTMADPPYLASHPILSAIVGRVDELNYLFDLLKMAGGEDANELDTP